LLSEIEDRRKRNPPTYYTEEELRSFLSKIASALQFAHSRGVAHRDINPEHIYITPDEDHKLSDFGAAWREADHKALSRTLTGQLIFMCPVAKKAFLEGRKLASEAYDAKKADVYSLGVTLLYMGKLFPPNTLGKIPNHEENVNVLLANMTERGVSLQFAEIIRNMLRVGEADRFDIDNVLEALSLPNPPPTMFALTPSQLHFFSFPDDSWRTVALTGSAIQVNEHTATTVLNSETLFGCGGGNRPCKCLSRQEDLYRDN
jgi:serine/threonine protein kinase